MKHSGVARDDPRNAGAIAFFMPGVMQAGEPPLSQSLDEVTDPIYGLGTHPDIIEIMWKLDDTLPERCRWVFWGRPSLVHPETGVVFAVGMGTVGFVMRLPDEVLQGADQSQADVTVSFNPDHRYDIGPAGPEWRFTFMPAPRVAWCQAAYDFAGTSARTK
jgi:hypothetical protein